MVSNTGLTIFWLVVLGVFLTGIAVAMPVVQAKKGSIKHFGVKCILIAVILVIACCFAVLHAFYGADSMQVGPSGAAGSVVNFVSEILLPMFLIFAGYFIVLGVFFPERKYEKKQEEREKKAREKHEQNSD